MGHELWIMPLAAVGVLVLLWWHGLLSTQSLRDAPQRNVGFGGLELFLGALIFVGCMAMARPLFDALGLMEPDPPPDQFVKRTVLGQMMHLPLTIYVVWRAGRYAGGLRELGMIPNRPWRDAGAAALALPAALMVVFGLNVVVLVAGEAAGYPRPEIGHELLRVAQSLESPAVLALLVLSAVVAAPLFEEIIFRGWLQTCLLGVFGRPWRWLAVIASSTIFTVMHVGMPWQVLPGLFVLSLILGWIYERTGSLLPGILLHAGFNALNLAVTLIVPMTQEN